ncbi:MAG: restriction endonuclease subunit S [Saprospiraceae bacterium]|nr:restriction endonuclease subunit S [Saprospiraceae bacterium]
MRKPYPKYKPTPIIWLSQVPEHWNIFRFKSLLKSETNGVWGDDPKGDENDILCLRVADFDRDFEVLSQENNTVRNVSPRDYENRKLMDGDLLIEKSGGGELLPIGRVGIYSWEEKRAVCSNFMARLKPQLRYTNTRFLFYLFKASYVFRLNLLAIKQTTGIQNLDTANFFNLKISVPPLPEQTQIAKFLDYKCALIDTAIQKKTRLIELLKEQKQAIINRAVTRGLNPDAPMKDSGIEWLGKIPEHWKVTKFRRIINKIEQGWSPFCEGREADVEEWGIMKVGCVNQIEFNPLENKALPKNLKPKEDYELHKGDLLMSRANTKELLGSISVVGDIRPKLMLCDKLYRIHTISDIDKEFLVFLLRALPSRRQIEEFATGASSSMQNISQAKILRLWLALPNTDEQIEIRNFIKNESKGIDVTISRIEQEIELIKEYKTALIAEAVTGKIDVREWKPKSKITNQVENVANL